MANYVMYVCTDDSIVTPNENPEYIYSSNDLLTTLLKSVLSLWELFLSKYIAVLKLLLSTVCSKDSLSQFVGMNMVVEAFLNNFFFHGIAFS